MTDNELKAAAMGIITYVCIMQTGKPPEIDEDGQIVEASAILDNAILEQTLAICSAADVSSVELFEEDDE